MTGRPTTRLDTARLVLDALRVEDAAEMAEVLADQEPYTFIGGAPPTRAELEERYRRWQAGGSAEGDEEWHNWVVRLREGGAAIGSMQATIYRPRNEADIAWVVAPRWQGVGFASEAVRAVAAWLLESVGGVTAHVHPDHEASQDVARRAGLNPTDRVEDGEVVWIGTAGSTFPKARVVARHEIPGRPPVRVARGDRVTVGRRDEEWRAFVFVEARGGSGWVPSRYLSAESGDATVTHAYDTAELPVEPGTDVDIIARDDESGWLWCRAADGREGWVPARCLEEPDAALDANPDADTHRDADA